MNKDTKNNQRPNDRGGRRGRQGRPNRGGDQRGPQGSPGQQGNKSYEDRNSFGNRDRSRYERPNRDGRGREDRGRGGDRGPRPPRREGDEPRRRSEPGVEFTGRTVSEVMEEACRRFGTNRDQMKVQVVSEGTKGFLGFLGTKPAVVRVQLTPGAIPVYGETVLSKILKEMGLPDKVKRKRDSDGNTILDIQGPSGGVLIGRHGQTLEALQYMVAKIIQRVTTDERSMIIVDVEGYCERQNDKLRELAKNLASKAKESGEEVSLRPMSAKERRIVHMTLKDDAEVTTQSRGEGLRRRVVVIPKNKKEAPVPASPDATPVEAMGDAPVVEASGSNPIADDSKPSEYHSEAVGNEAPAPEPPIADEVGNQVPAPAVVQDDIGNR
jgi:spoIIIJ-associated protein